MRKKSLLEHIRIVKSRFRKDNGMRGGDTISNIIVVYAKDPDDTIFKDLINVLEQKAEGAIETTTITNSKIYLGGIEMNALTQEVFCRGQKVFLNHAEFAVLLHMVQHPGCVFTKEQIYKAVWKEDEKYSSNTVQNTICRLRKKLEPDPHRPIYIKTIIGLGYKFELPDI